MLHKFCNWENLSNALTAAWAFPEAIKLEFILLLEKGQYHLLAALMKCHKIRGKTVLWSHKKVVGSGLLEVLWEGLLCLKRGQRGSKASWCGHEWAVQVSCRSWAGSRAVEMTWEECDDMRSTVCVWIASPLTHSQNLANGFITLGLCICETQTNKPFSRLTPSIYIL